MPAFQRILLCYDGTREGQHALADGAALAVDLRAEVHLLSVLDNASWVQGADVLSAVPVDLVNESAKSLLDEGRQKLAARGIRASVHLAVGDPLVGHVEIAPNASTRLFVVSVTTTLPPATVTLVPLMLKGSVPLASGCPAPVDGERFDP